MTRERGRTLLVVTHSPQIAERADRSFTIEAGRLVPHEAPAGARA